ncbi:MAG: DUF554 domain-containing protein [Coriobacteriaceae bacterium]|nr:DUF554 domain-containing protein [Coriobacteriaceae bacterium]
MIGTIVNTACILVGSLAGGLLKKLMSERLSEALFSAMGLAAFLLGVNAVVQNMPNSSYPVLFIASLALGGAVGSALRLSDRMERLTNRKGDGRLGEGLVTGCLLFCIGTLSILGPVQSALYGDETFLFTNAMLDLVTSAVLASTYGIGMALAAGVLFAWQGAIYALTLLLGDFISATMMTELSIVGGALIVMSGLSILKVKDFKTLDFLPALAVPIAWCLLAPLLGI